MSVAATICLSFTANLPLARWPPYPVDELQVVCHAGAGRRAQHPERFPGLTERTRRLLKQQPVLGGGGSPRRRCRRRAAPRALAGVADVVLLHLAVERRPVKTENLRRLLLVPVGPLQRLHDRHLL